MGTTRAVVNVVLGRETVPGYEFEFYMVRKIQTPSRHHEFNIHPLPLAGKDVQDIIRSPYQRQFADVVIEVLVIEPLEILAERTDILYNPKVSDLLKIRNR